MKVLKEKKTDNWGTPWEIIQLVESILGSIDTDPCSESKYSCRITLRTRYTVEDDGLTKDWPGTVFMNPPYSNPKPWVEKFFSEYKTGNMSKGIGLLPASTDTQWFKQVWGESNAVCFLHGRIKFLDVLDGYKQKYPARTGSALIYCGKDVDRFDKALSLHGKTIRPHY